MTVENIELSLLKRRSYFILNNSYSCMVTDNISAVPQSLYSSYVKSYGCIELKCTAAGSSLGVTEHNADLLTELVDEDADAV